MRSREHYARTIARVGLWLLVGGLLTVGLLPDSAVRATDPEVSAGPDDDVPVLSEAPAMRMAPHRPPTREPLPPGTGFIPPPMDLSHLTGQQMPEGVPALDILPPEWDWRDAGKVTPVWEDQGSCDSSYAFATNAGFESKILIDIDSEIDISENHAKECNWRELNNFEDPPGTPWGSCDGGNADMVASLFSQTGTVRDWCDRYVASDEDCKTTCPYRKTLLDWRIISGPSIPATEVLKQYIYDHGPVITSMYVDESQGFDGSYDGLVTLNYTATEGSTNHMVLITGWSNNLPSVPDGAGPADGWIVKNSWGSDWGDSGYFYITYGAANIGMYSSFVHDWQDYDPDGSIWYYDDDGWSNQFGCPGSTAAWALARFIPDEDTWATRVEFWTNDAASVDVHLFDYFDGTTLSNHLASKLGSSFNEAGYHSVELDASVPVTNGNDIIVVVAYTNASYEEPITTDSNGPFVPERSYYRCPNDVSWHDMGVEQASDATIRLRTSRRSSLTLTKTVVNDDGGTASEADFRPYVSSSPVSWDTLLSLSPGTHVVTETQVSGYEAQAWAGDCETDGTLVAAPGGEYSCTITNDDIAPTVTLTKTVVNNNGGTLTEDDFQPYIGGLAVSWRTPVSVLSGTHTVSETQVSGYAASPWAAFCTPDGTLTVEVGGVYTCTIINDDIGPTVTSITPNTGVNTDTIHITDLAGSDFQLGATVTLVKAGRSDIPGTGVSVESASKITCDFDLNRASGGTWSVVVTNPDSRFGVLPEGFEVHGNTFVYLPLVRRH